MQVQKLPKDQWMPVLQEMQAAKAEYEKVTGEPYDPPKKSKGSSNVSMCTLFQRGASRLPQCPRARARG